MTPRDERGAIDGKVEREFLSHLKRLVKAQERIADALEATNAADPLAMIQGALEERGRVTATEDAPLDDETELANIRAYVAALR